MKVSFVNDNAFEEFMNWAFEDKRIFKKLGTLINDIKRNRYEGIGKPEPLKHDFSGFWSRRIDEKHRLVYTIIEIAGQEDELVIISCKDHYE